MQRAESELNKRTRVHHWLQMLTVAVKHRLKSEYKILQLNQAKCPPCILNEICLMAPNNSYKGVNRVFSQLSQQT